MSRYYSSEPQFDAERQASHVRSSAYLCTAAGCWVRRMAVYRAKAAPCMLLVQPEQHTALRAAPLQWIIAASTAGWQRLALPLQEVTKLDCWQVAGLLLHVTVLESATAA